MKQIQYLIVGLLVLFVVIVQAQKCVVAEPIKNIDTTHFYMNHSYDVLKYQLSFDLYECYIEPYSSAFSATEDIILKVDSALNAIRLNAVNTSLQIDSVGLSATSFSHFADTLVIHLNSTYQPGSVLPIKIYYKHKNVVDHAFYSNEGFVFTDTPPEGSRRWFPCWDRPSDKALLDLTAKVPANVKLGSNGSLVDSLSVGDTLIYHWISKDPMATYLMAITSSSKFLLKILYWHKLSCPNDSIPIRFYFQSGQTLDSIEKNIRPMIDYYSSIFGEYPFEKIGFATLNGAFPWGGMENQTMINLTRNGWQEGLISHEFAHQWFGDLITCGTWADIWLNESFGTYCESLYLEHKGGTKAYKTHLNTQAEFYLAKNPGFPIYNPSWAIHTPDVNLLYNSVVIYDKGACVLHQLRYVMGDNAFFKLIKSYATDTNFMFKNAITSDFIAKANEINGSDLNWFFNEWISHPNHPLYSNTYDIQNIGVGKWKVRLLVSQYQTNTIFYKMPIQVKIVFADSTNKIIKRINDRNNQLFEFFFSKKPAYVEFDPFSNILLKNASTTLGIKPSKTDGGQ